MGKVVNHDEVIRLALHPSVSELEYKYKKFDLHCGMARKFAHLIPYKYRYESVSILEKSGCFRDWVIQIIEWNNVGILGMLEAPNFPNQTLQHWYNWQLFFIDENGVKPPKIVLQAAVNEWLHRIGSRSSEYRNEPVKP